MTAYVKLGGEFAVDLVFGHYYEHPQVTVLADGRYVVIWGDDDLTLNAGFVNAQMFAADGTPLGSQIAIAGPLWYANEPTVTALAGGGFVAVWDNSDTWARIYDGNGIPTGAAFALPPSIETVEGIASLADGGFAVVWTGSDAGTSEYEGAVYLRTFDASGAATSGDILVNTTIQGGQVAPFVTALAGGGVVVTWTDHAGTQAGGDDRIMAQVFDASGAKVGSELTLAAAGSHPGVWNSPVTALPDGNFAVTWEVNGTGAFETRVFTPAGVQVGAPIVTLERGIQYQGGPDIAALADGSIAVVWMAKTAPLSDGSSHGIFVQVYAADGTPLSTEMLVNTQVNGEQATPTIAATPDGGFVVTWVDFNEAGNDADDQVRVQAFGPVESWTPVVIGSNGGGASASLSLAENLTAVTTVTASGGEAALSYRIVGGADAARFAIDATSGALTFVAAPDYENRNDANLDRTYEVVVSATDGTVVDTQALSVTVTNANDIVPFLASTGETDIVYNYIENSTAVVRDYDAIDADGTPLTFSVSGAEAEAFTIDAVTGVLRFVTPPDYDAPGGSARHVTVTVSDGVNSDSTELTVYVSNVNEAPVITSNGGGATAALTVNENTTAVATVVAMDPENSSTRIYSISGGTDSARFTINSSTGVLAFVAAPNFEAPTDSNADNVYQVIVRASDGSLSDTQTISVTVTNVNEAPVITSNGGGDTFSRTQGENATAVTTFVATDDLTTPTYAITGGADAARFTINATTGVLTFVAAPNYEAPADADGDNIYHVIVTASDGTLTDSQTLTVRIIDSSEAPVITSNGGGDTAAVTVSENTTAVTTVAAADPELLSSTYAIVGGTDSARFTIDAATGALSFASAPNFEMPGDANGDNVYQVIVRATDEGGMTDSQTLSVTVTNVAEAPVITSGGGGDTAALTVNENTTAVTTVTAIDSDLNVPTYAIVGGADAARFTINAATGALAFVAAPNYEAPGDADGNNIYQVIVGASDGSLSDSQTIAITVTNVNEPLEIVSNGGGATAAVTVSENTTAVTTVVGANSDPSPIVYSIAGGADAARFTINASTGVLAFVNAPNFEARSDVGSNNVYDVIVRVDQAGNSPDTQAIAVTVTNVNEAPVITSNGGGASASITVGEGSTAVTTVAATDPEGSSRTYSISGGADAARFAIDAGTGALSFVAATDFEAPADADGDNVYDVVVSASDGSLSDSQALSVAVADIDEANPLAFLTTAYRTYENVFTPIWFDMAGGNGTIAVSIVGGADAAHFVIGTYGDRPALNFGTHNFEAPTDVNGDGTYEVQVKVVSGFETVTATFTVAVGNVNDGEGPFFLTAPEWTVAERQRVVGIVQAPEDYPESASYFVVGGPDAACFTIDQQTGELKFVANPDFEAPADADGDNVYEVQIAAQSYDYAYSGQPATQWVTVTVTDIDDASVPGFTTTAFEIPEVAPVSVMLAVTGMDTSNGVTYSIVGGEDAPQFQIDELTGELFRPYSPLDFEFPYDEDRDNVYELEVQAESNGVIITDMVTIAVRDVVNERLFFASDDEWTVANGQTLVGTMVGFSAYGHSLTYAVTGGADAASFAIDPNTGELVFVVAPDFTAPGDAGGDNVYDVQIAVSDFSETEYQQLTITVADTGPPLAFAQTAFDLGENVTLDAVLGMLGVSGSDPIVFEITGGDDAFQFALNPDGTLKFWAADFESAWDTDGDNVYEVEVTAQQGARSATETLSFTVHNVEEAPAVFTTPYWSLNENLTSVGQIGAWDPDGGSVTFGVPGGPDGHLFNIGPSGQLSFIAAPDFEAPADADGNNVYEIALEVSDGTLSTATSVFVTVKDVVEVVTFAATAFSTPENTTTVATLQATGGSEPMVYSIVGGADAALFTLNASTGQLRFVSAQNYEAPGDAGANRVYDVVVRAASGALSAEETVQVTLTNVNEAPVITSNGGGSTAAISVAENLTAVTTVTSTDPEGTSRTYSISGGADAARFTINATTGQLVFTSSRNFESPTDANGNNVYEVTVRASDGTLSDTQAISVTVTNVNEAPSITSNGGGTTGTVSVQENATAVTTVVASDPESAPRTYSISGGTDAVRFTINATTGALAFVTAPNFEQPTDTDRNNTYVVAVQASDGILTDTQTLTVTVGNVNEAPVIMTDGGGSTAALTVFENATIVTTVGASDPEGGLTYAVIGGADAALFTVGSTTGVLRFKTAPEFEGPRTDAGGDGVYNVTVGVSDGSLTDTQAFTLTLANVEEGVFFNSAPSSVSVAENATAVVTVRGYDEDGYPPTYAIAGGADAAAFAIDSATGALRFVSAPNFETPGDADGNNVYQVIVSLTDGTFTDTRAMSVTVTNANEAVTLTSGTAFAIAENGLAVTTVTASDLDGTAPAFSISGGADAALFTIDAATGALAFVAAPDHEAPADADGDNLYEVVVSASDGTLSDSRALTITVGNVNEALALTSGTAFAVAENGLAVTTVTASDLDGTAPAFSIAGGADAALFAIDAATGALTFVAAPDFETPGDADGDNVYEVVVSASDGTLSDSRALSVTVTNANEAVTLTSGTAFAVAENGLAVTTVTASDLDGTAPAFAIAGGADAALFAIDATTGALAFVAAQDFEAPGDADGDNVYEVVVSASDGSLADSRTISVTLTNVNEPVTLTSATAIGVAENSLAVTIVTASDLDGTAPAFAIAGGADAALFAIDAGTGALSFVAAPDYEAAGDADGDNVYEVVVSASDGSLSDSHALAITVSNVNEQAAITSSAAATVLEGATAVTTVTADDPDGDTLAFAITGGADAARFAIDAATGALSFVTARDFEAPGDADGDNVYQVTVAASDGTNSVSQALSVTVADANEDPVITSGGGGATGAVLVAEGQTAVTTVVASDPDGGQVPSYSIAGVYDWRLFTIDPVTGALRFIAAPDYEAPDAGAPDNAYDVAVVAYDAGGLFDVQWLSVYVANVNEAPAIASPLSVAFDENETAVIPLWAIDPDSEVTYAIGGADAALFGLDASTGELFFADAPDFEAAGDANGDNVYEIVVSASDGSLSDTRAMAITVGNVDEAPVITSAAAAAVSENGTFVTTVTAADPEGGVAYALAGGADAALFHLDSATGVLSFVTARDFEAPGDANGDNVYEVTIAASDGANGVTQAISVTVANANETPVITSGGGQATATALVAENQTAVATIVASDPDSGSSPTYGIAGGAADWALFTINAATGALSFVAAPDFDAPGDANHDNVYEVAVIAYDGGGLYDMQYVSVTVGNLVDGLTINGTSKADTLNGSYEEDAISGLAGNDTLSGLAANDVLDGGDGADRLIGGAGADTLTGGLRADDFVYQATGDSTLAASDRILDFSHAQGDRIDLSAIDARTAVGGNQAFSFIGTAAFSVGSGGQLRYAQQGGDTIVQGDVNGDGAADFQLIVDPLVNLVASDFVL